MRVKIERSGGFIGMHRTVIVDTESLDVENREELLRLVKEADLFNLRSSKPKRGADYMLYRIRVEEGKRSNTIEIADISMNEPLRRLVELVSRIG